MQQLLHKVQMNTKRGFTMVETLVAITIFIMIVMGPLTIAWSSMQSAYFANEQTTAIFLAQEALESIRLQRDNQGLIAYKDDSKNDEDNSAWNWYDTISDRCKDMNGCDLDRSGGSYITCPTRGCELQQYKFFNEQGSADTQGNHPGYIYGYSSGNPNNWEESPYRRKIELIDDIQNRTGLLNNESNGVQVKVTVTWKPSKFNSERSVVLESWLYNQYKRYDEQ